MKSESVVVIGGGLAGITAALRLADRGQPVTLIEAKPRLGGLTTSFRRGDLDVDTGQHVFLRCCTAYRGLLDRLGVTALTTLQDRLDVPVIRAADGRQARLRRGPLPVVGGLPLHLMRSLATYRALPVTARSATARAALALRSVDPADPSVDETSFGDWLAEHGQSRTAIDALWDLIGIAALNARADDASLALAATVFQIGMLTDPGAADIGWPTVPLHRLHAEPAMRALRDRGVEVLLRTRVTAVAPLPDGWSVRTDSASLAADAVIVATDPPTTERLLPPGALDLAPGWSERLGATPIVNVHAVFDRRVMTEPFLACVGSPLQWLFDRTGPAGLQHGQYVAASLSAADDVAGRPVAELRDALLPAFARVLPAVRDAALRDFFVTREPHATFRQAPGCGRWRPPASTRLPGLVLAGAHTQTGWPATMEGAVRSGETAAELLRQHRTVAMAGAR
ncbi:MAG TPA: hydroxysqualene dehydroxylase HpnE [Mycobacteriales bacterium]|nr:hydroxysqualene dehydroxylase HpnE [Mycobacteriales bacterium]